MRKHSRMFKVWVLSALLVFAASIIVTISGCMTPAQSKAFNSAMDASRKAEAKIAEYEAEITAIKRMIAEKKIDPEEGKKIIARYKADKEAFAAIYAENKKAMADMKANELPWYAYALYGLNIVNAVGGSALGYGKVSGVLKAFGTLSRGTEEIINVLGDSPKEVLPAADAKKILGAHAARDGTGGTLKTLHHDSLAGTI